MLALGSLDGPGVALGARRHGALTSAQAQATRNALWLRAVEVGISDPITGRIRRFKVAELTLLWGLTAQAVRNGLAAARALRQEVTLACQ